MLGYGLSRLLASCSSCSLSVCSCAPPRSTRRHEDWLILPDLVKKTSGRVPYLALQTPDPLPVGLLSALQDALGLQLALPQTLRLQVQFLVVAGRRLQEALCVTLLQL